MEYCCKDTIAWRDEWIEWYTGIKPPAWVIWVGATGEYEMLVIKYCPFCGAELENREEM